MRIKTIIIILITILLTVILMQNAGAVYFKFLWATFLMSKLLVLLFVAVISFVLGVLVGRPKKVRKLGGDPTDNNYDKGPSSTLSEDDKDYIN
ncbi:MAG: LapA family protein [Mucilaginibacter sp.]|uniref:LapA family protein n=1 Tax=Mucilaginibacter sp. L3T2-6 TaxID=3062491 RepID=UPI002674BBC5|nr:LapA family protein [Mucilaginibacter sp. L3T2-6]MDO3642735.1 LapA family protein [Mucilaginibacter sp. L3T2-6]MDV6215384.1 LapA family protein [Mucilaginibacter sp. L3T2-6]